MGRIAQRGQPRGRRQPEALALGIRAHTPAVARHRHVARAQVGAVGDDLVVGVRSSESRCSHARGPTASSGSRPARAAPPAGTDKSPVRDRSDERGAVDAQLIDADAPVAPRRRTRRSASPCCCAAPRCRATSAGAPRDTAPRARRGQRSTAPAHRGSGRSRARSGLRCDGPRRSDVVVQHVGVVEDEAAEPPRTTSAATTQVHRSGALSRVRASRSRSRKRGIVAAREQQMARHEQQDAEAAPVGDQRVRLAADSGRSRSCRSGRRAGCGSRTADARSRRAGIASTATNTSSRAPCRSTCPGSAPARARRGRTASR